MEHLLPDELSSVLEDRWEFLQALAREPRVKRDLTDELDVSDSTAGRALRALDDVGLVHYGDGAWQLTVFGRLVFEVRRDYQRRLRESAALAPVLQNVAAPEYIDLRLLDGASAYSNGRDTPKAVLTELLRVIDGADDIRIITPVVLPLFGGAFLERAQDGPGSTIEMIVPENTLERAHATSPEFTSRLLEYPNVTVRRADVPYTFGVLLVDMERTGLVVFGEYGTHGLLVNDTTDAVEWAAELYYRVDEDATPAMIRGGRTSARDPP